MAKLNTAKISSLKRYRPETNFSIKLLKKKIIIKNFLKYNIVKDFPTHKNSELTDFYCIIYKAVTKPKILRHHKTCPVIGTEWSASYMPGDLFFNTMIKDANINH